jgi:glucose-6-phosphate dehydrogenase assembly protein OpcA
VGEPPDQIAHDPLGVLAGRRISDVAQTADPLAALATRAADYAPGDTDLSWTRTTGWRALLASAFDALDSSASEAVVSAESGNPSAALLAAWLGRRLDCPARVEDSKGPGITAVAVSLAGGQQVTINRPDGRVAVLSRVGQPERALPLPRRETGDLLAEELRRLDADQPYAEALALATGTSEDLSARPAERTHIWVDPAQEAAAEALH